MLKIKDDVDLKQLKYVYGFSDDNENGFYEYFVGNTQCLRVHMWDRKIKIIQMIISSSGEKRTVSDEILEKLYILQSHNLVEKV